MLLHIGLSLTDIEEVTNFYENILSFRIHHRFALYPEIALDLFGVNKSVDVVVMEKEGLQLELFIHQEMESKTFTHLCLVEDALESMAEKARKAGYRLKERRQPGKVTYFLWDHSGNLFELK